ncbi:MAG: hypothetical protein R6W77_13660 [Trueperaceae bacterium]
MTAHGQGAAMVDPASVVHVAAPGETIAGVVRVTNPMEEVLRLRVYLSDWTLDPVGQFTFAEVGTLPASASPWITFSPSVLDVEPHATLEVRYDVQVPADASAGTHQSVLFVESEPSEAVPGQMAATFSVRVGHVVYVNVPPLVKEGAITAIFGEPPTAAGEPYHLTVLYENRGNAAQGVQGSLVVSDDRGEVAIEADVERNVVLPNSTRAFEINLHGLAPGGTYTALVVLDYGDAEREVAGSFDFVVPEITADPDGAS